MTDRPVNIKPAYIADGDPTNLEWSRKLGHSPEFIAFKINIDSAIAYLSENIVRPARKMVGELRHVLLGLLGDAAQGRARLLGLDDPRRLAADEQQIITRTARKLELPNRDTGSRVAIELVLVLQNPARRLQ